MKEKKKKPVIKTYSTNQVRKALKDTVNLNAYCVGTLTIKIPLQRRTSEGRKYKLLSNQEIQDFMNGLSFEATRMLEKQGLELSQSINDGLKTRLSKLQARLENCKRYSSL